MDEQRAFDLALSRAISLIALLNEFKIESVTDYYLNEIEDNRNDEFKTKFSEFVKFSTVFNIDTSNLKIVNSFRTKYKETILKVKYDLDIADTDVYNDSIFFDGEYLSIEYQKNKKYENNSRIELNFNYLKNNVNNINKYYFLSRSISYITDITSVFNGKKSNSEHFCYRYEHNVPNSDNEEGKQYFATNNLYYGLWNAYITSLFKGISLVSRTNEVKLGNLGDFYSKKTQNLTREIISTKISFRIFSLKLNKNKMIVKIEKI